MKLEPSVSKLESDLYSLERRFELRGEELREVLERVRQLENAVAKLRLGKEVAGVLEEEKEYPRQRPQTLDAILEERERAWTQDYQPRIKELENWKVRLEEENVLLKEENVLLKAIIENMSASPRIKELENWKVRLEEENEELYSENVLLKANIENMSASYERLQQAHTALHKKVSDRGLES